MPYMERVFIYTCCSGSQCSRICHFDLDILTYIVHQMLFGTYSVLFCFCSAIHYPFWSGDDLYVTNILSLKIFYEARWSGRRGGIYVQDLSIYRLSIHSIGKAEQRASWSIDGSICYNSHWMSIEASMNSFSFWSSGSWLMLVVEW